jgi:hypothetical protein
MSSIGKPVTALMMIEKGSFHMIKQTYPMQAHSNLLEKLMSMYSLII